MNMQSPSLRSRRSIIAADIFDMNLPLEMMKPARQVGQGTLPDAAIKQLIEYGAIRSKRPFDEDQVQPSSLDLTIGDTAYDIGFSFLPGEDGVVEKLMNANFRRIDIRKEPLLRPNNTYILPLNETLKLPAAISAVANAKSSTGRIDVFARLLTDHAISFDCVPGGYSGRLWLEITPRSFPITLKPDMRFNQIRFRVGTAGDDVWLMDADLAAIHRSTPLVSEDLHLGSGVILSADLEGTETDGIIGYEAVASKRTVSPDAIRMHRTSEYWRTIRADAGPMLLRPGRFYILATKELIQVPPGLAAEVVSVDPRWGSHQSHIAGFIDPGFGYTDGRRPGARLVLEIRTWDVPFQVRHGQPICRIQYESMAVQPEAVYGGKRSNYTHQKGVKLSKVFF